MRETAFVDYMLRYTQTTPAAWAEILETAFLLWETGHTVAWPSLAWN